MITTTDSVPYWRLSSFYFFYFGALGAIVPYWGLYLQSLDYGPTRIGELMAIIMATKIIAPNILGYIADHTGHSVTLVRLASLLAMLTFLGVFMVQEFLPLALVMTLFSFFWNASLPQFEAVTFNYLGARAHRYAHVRLWGSVGFIISVLGVGIALEWAGAQLVPKVILVFFLGIWLSSLLVSDRDARPIPRTQPPLLALLKRPEILAFLLTCFLMQASHGGYYAFYSIYMRDHGYTSTMIGWLWALGVVAEVLIFLGMHQLLHKFSARLVLLASLLLAALRWLLIGVLPDLLTAMLVAQLLHAATFGTFHAAAIHLVHRYFVGRHQGRGQALYSSVSFGAGGAVGSLLSGYLWEGFGAGNTFLISVGIALLASLIAWRWISRT